MKNLFELLKEAHEIVYKKDHWDLLKLEIYADGDGSLVLDSYGLFTVFEFRTLEEAEQKLKDYIKKLNNGKTNKKRL